MRRIIISIATIIAVSGCGPTVRSVPTKLSNADPPTDRSTVEIVFGTPKQCYEQLAFIEGDSSGGSVSETLEMMRAESATYGADAMIVLSHADASAANTIHGASRSINHNYAAIAARFTACPEAVVQRNPES